MHGFHLKKLCIKHDFQYFNPYDTYVRNDGCLDKLYSDNNVHLRNNTTFLNRFLSDIYI